MIGKRIATRLAGHVLRYSVTLFLLLLKEALVALIAMPGVKAHTIRRKKRKPPTRVRKSDPLPTPATSDAVATSQPPISGPLTLTTDPPPSLPDAVPPSSEPSAATTSTPVGPPRSTPAPLPLTASERKLSKSPFLSVRFREGEGGSESESDSESRPTLDDHCDSPNFQGTLEGEGTRVVEVAGVQAALLDRCVCRECGGGPVEFREDLYRREGLVTHLYLYCVACAGKSPIPYAKVGTTRRLALNESSVLANKCAGGTHPSLDLVCTMMGLPPPISAPQYAEHSKIVCAGCTLQAASSMEQARREVMEHYSIDVASGEVADVLVSCDGTWQKRGFISLYGIVFIIAHETGKVLDYHMMAKECAGCRRWEGKDQSSQEYADWKAKHKCTANFDGSSCSMEPRGTLVLFERSLQHGMRYKYLISDGDSKSHNLIVEQQPYGEEHQVEKMDCIGHVQKRVGTALRELKKRHSGQKLSDGKTISGQGRLTDSLIDSLQYFYGLAIRKSVGNVDNMVKSVQATLSHLSSTDDNPQHHLCPEGPDSWCKFQKALAKKEPYTHEHPPIPEAIVQLLKPVYARLGARGLLEKCVNGYTQNANESLHSVVWKHCPKVLHTGKAAVETACALAVCSWNDGVSSFSAIAQNLQVPLGSFAKAHLETKDIARVKKARYKATEASKQLRRKARRRRKGLLDKQQSSEGVMYAAGAFDCDPFDSEPGPSGGRGRGGGGRGRGGGGRGRGGGGRGRGGGGGKGKGRAGGGGALAKGKKRNSTSADPPDSGAPPPSKRPRAPP